MIDAGLFVGDARVSGSLYLEGKVDWASVPACVCVCNVGISGCREMQDELFRNACVYIGMRATWSPALSPGKIDEGEAALTSTLLQQLRAFAPLCFPSGRAPPGEGVMLIRSQVCWAIIC